MEIVWILLTPWGICIKLRNSAGGGGHPLHFYGTWESPTGRISPSEVKRNDFQMEQLWPHWDHLQIHWESMVNVQWSMGGPWWTIPWSMGRLRGTHWFFQDLHGILHWFLKLYNWSYLCTGLKGRAPPHWGVCGPSMLRLDGVRELTNISGLWLEWKTHVGQVNRKSHDHIKQIHKAEAIQTCKNFEEKEGGPYACDPGRPWPCTFGWRDGNWPWANSVGSWSCRTP